MFIKIPKIKLEFKMYFRLFLSFLKFSCSLHRQKRNKLNGVRIIIKESDTYVARRINMSVPQTFEKINVWRQTSQGWQRQESQVFIWRINNNEIGGWSAQGPRCSWSCRTQLVRRRYGNADAGSLMQEVVTDAGAGAAWSWCWSAGTGCLLVPEQVQLLM